MKLFFQRACCRRNFRQVDGTSVQTLALWEYRTSHFFGVSRFPPSVAADIFSDFLRSSRSTYPVIWRSVANLNSFPRNLSWAHSWTNGSKASRRKAERQPEAQVTAPYTLSSPFDSRNWPSYQVSWTFVSRFVPAFSARPWAETAPAFGWALKAFTSRSIACFPRTESESAKAKIEPVAWGTAASIAFFFPRFFGRWTMRTPGWVAANASRIAGVLSVLPSSTTMSSRLSYV